MYHIRRVSFRYVQNIPALSNEIISVLLTANFSNHQHHHSLLFQNASRYSKYLGSYFSLENTSEQVSDHLFLTPVQFLTISGVILSTAFVHLLQDAFEALNNPVLRSRSKIGNYTGLIVCVPRISCTPSLIALFVS